jgi:hypothetical protein
MIDATVGASMSSSSALVRTCCSDMKGVVQIIILACNIAFCKCKVDLTENCVRKLISIQTNHIST